MKKNLGFSIIEILIVILIIMVLAAIVLFAIIKYQKQAKFVAMKSSLNELSKQSERHYIENSNYADFFTDNSTGIFAVLYQIIAMGGIPAFFAYPDPVENWCICADMDYSLSGSSYCVDSTGYRKEVSHSCFLGGTDWRCKVFNRTPPASCID